MDPDAGYRSRIDHAREEASPEYYSVFLEDYGVQVELSATTRAGFQRHTFPASDSARILIDLLTPTEYGYEVDWAYIRRVSDTEIEGFSKQKTYDWFSSLNNEYTIHFVIQFDKPFESLNGWIRFEYDKATCGSEDPALWLETDEINGRGDVGAWLNFKTTEGEVIQVRSGISLVSVEQARFNLETKMEPFGWNFEAVR